MLVGTAITGASTSPPTTEGQGPLHSRHDDDHAASADLLRPVEQAVQPGHAHVVEAVDGGAEERRRHGRFLRHRQVGGSGADDRNPAGQGRAAAR